MDRVAFFDELTGKIQRGTFSSADSLTAWLAEKGYAIAPTPIQGSLFPRDNVCSLSKYRKERGKRATGNGDTTDEILTLMQGKLLSALVNSDIPSLDGVNIVSLGRMVAHLTQASIAHKRWLMEFSDKARGAAEAVERVARKGGLSQEAVQTIRSEILGIAS